MAIAAAGVLIEVISQGLTRTSAGNLVLIIVLGLMVFLFGPRPTRLVRLTTQAERLALSLLHA